MIYIARSRNCLHSVQGLQGFKTQGLGRAFRWIQDVGLGLFTMSGLRRMDATNLKEALCQGPSWINIPPLHKARSVYNHFRAPVKPSLTKPSAAITFQGTEDPMCGTSATPDSQHQDHQNHRHRQPQPQNSSNSDAARIGPLHHSCSYWMCML